MAPKILLSSSADGAPYYEAAILAAGGVPTACYCPSDGAGFDGLLLCGGGDIAPARFGQENHGSHPPDLLRDAAELKLTGDFIAADKPVLGICRGLQLLNVALGGTLIQDLGPVSIFHSKEPDEVDDKVHPIRAEGDSLLAEWYGPLFPVNSYHHQALDRLGKGLRAIAWSESGVVEAAVLPGRAVLGLQFHPERMTGSRSRPDTVDGAAVFRWFVDRCGGQN